MLEVYHAISLTLLLSRPFLLCLCLCLCLCTSLVWLWVDRWELKYNKPADRTKIIPSHQMLMHTCRTPSLSLLGVPSPRFISGLRFTVGHLAPGCIQPHTGALRDTHPHTAGGDVPVPRARAALQWWQTFIVCSHPLPDMYMPSHTHG